MAARPKDYENVVEYDISESGSDVRRYLVAKWDLDGGKVVRCCVSYEVEVPGHRRTQVVRYDDAHPHGYHRHEEGFPVKDEVRIPIDGVSANDRVKFAWQEIKANYRAWETKVLARRVLGMEAVDDDD